MSTARGVPQPFWRTWRGALFAGMVLTSLWAWWIVAWPVLGFANPAKHEGHFATTYLHALGGTAMLLLGAANLYLAAMRTNWRWHRWVGKAYVALGLVGAGTAIAITSGMAHKDAGSTPFTNVTVSLLTLAAAWIAFTGLGWRAARNRRLDTHREMMVRSYILVWSFVACRIVDRSGLLEGDQVTEWLIWLSWVGPLIAGELVMQWPKGGRSGIARPATPTSPTEMA